MARIIEGDQGEAGGTDPQREIRCPGLSPSMIPPQMHLQDTGLDTVPETNTCTSPRRLDLIWIWERAEIGKCRGDSILQSRSHVISNDR